MEGLGFSTECSSRGGNDGGPTRVLMLRPGHRGGSTTNYETTVQSSEKVMKGKIYLGEGRPLFRTDDNRLRMSVTLKRLEN